MNLRFLPVLSVLIILNCFKSYVFANGKLDVIQWLETPTDLNADGIINAMDVFIAASQFNTGVDLFPQPTPDPRQEHLPNVGEIKEQQIQNGSILTLDYPTGNEAYLVLIRNESFSNSSIIAIEDNSQLTNPIAFKPEAKLQSNDAHIHQNGFCVIPTIKTYPNEQRVLPKRFQQLNVGQQRSFDLFGGVTVNATLQYVGTHAAIYVDDTIWMQGDLAIDQELVDREGLFFDETTYPVITSVFGTPGDVNNDGHIGILLSPSATEPGGSGFFFGGDLFSRRELDPSFPTNEMELLYVAPPNTNDTIDEDDIAPIIAHELQHLINFYFHSLVFGGRNGQNDEERWLDEGLSHLAEDFVAPGIANQNRRRQYLEQTDVQGIFIDNTFPNGTQRGGDYLFCRYLTDRFGEGIISKLVQTDKMGFDNISSAAGVSIEAIHRDWSRALFLSDLNINEDPVLNYSFFTENSNADGRDWGRPNFFDLDLSNLQFFGPLYFSPIAPGGFGYLVLRGSGGTSHDIRVTLDGGVLPAIDLIRLPDQFVFPDFFPVDAWVSDELDSVLLDEPLRDVFVVGEPRMITGRSDNGEPLTRIRAVLTRGSGPFSNQNIFEGTWDQDRFEVSVLLENENDVGNWSFGFLVNESNRFVSKQVQVVLP